MCLISVLETLHWNNWGKSELTCLVGSPDLTRIFWKYRQMSHHWFNWHQCWINSSLYTIYNEPTRCSSGSIVFINNCRYALHVLDASGTCRAYLQLLKTQYCQSCILLVYYILETCNAWKIKYKILRCMLHQITHMRVKFSVFSFFSPSSYSSTFSSFLYQTKKSIASTNSSFFSFTLAVPLLLLCAVASSNMWFCIRLAAKQCNKKSLSSSKLINHVNGGIYIGVIKIMTNCALWNWHGLLPAMVVAKE